MTKQKPKPVSTQHELVQCDLEFPRFQNELEDLELKELQEVDRCLDKIEKMTWAQVLATSSKQGKRGLNWEVISNQKTKIGATIASIRVTQKFRARVTRDGVFMRFISLHPDHDSAYTERGGEKIPEETAQPVESQKTNEKTIKTKLWFVVENNTKHVRGKSKAKEDIEQYVLSHYGAKQLDDDENEYEISFSYHSPEHLDKIIYEMLGDMHSQADMRNCFVDASVTSEDGEKSW